MEFNLKIKLSKTQKEDIADHISEHLMDYLFETDILDDAITQALSDNVEEVNKIAEKVVFKKLPEVLTEEAIDMIRKRLIE